MSTLEAKLGKWLAQQNEYPLLFLADRKTRRRAARLVAKRVFMLPTVPVQTWVDERGDTQRVPNRRERRDQTRAMKRQVGQYSAKLSKRARRLELQQERVARRVARLSERRRNELLAREEEVST
jgi:hypothetical protein